MAKIHKATDANCTLCGLNLNSRHVSDDWDVIDCGQCERRAGRKRKPKEKSCAPLLFDDSYLKEPAINA